MRDGRAVQVEHRATSPPRLDRETFEFSRGAEYFDARELQTMTGQPVERFAAVVVKELLDNAIDAAETAGVMPDLVLRVRRKRRLVVVTVGDNAGGMPPKLVEKVTNLETRTSDKVGYRSPTRGAQGNALKTVLGIPVALGVRCPVVIEACGVHHAIRAHVDPAGQPRIMRDVRNARERGGTWVAVALPAAACQDLDFRRWVRAFALFNPHASVKIVEVDGEGNHANCRPRARAKSYQRLAPTNWRKFLPTDCTSPHWYDAAALRRLVFSLIGAAERGGRDLLLRDFVRQFRGLTASAKAKAVCDQFPGIARLSAFEGGEGDVDRLLVAMRAEAKPPSPDVLGSVGEAHLRVQFEQWFGVRRWWYRKADGAVNGVPYVVEVALAETDRNGAVFHSVNFSPTFEDPLAGTLLCCDEFWAHGINGFLDRGHAAPADGTRPGHTAAAFHLVCPALEFLDKGKTRLKVQDQIAQAVSKVLWQAVKVLYREGERRKKDAARQERSDRRLERHRDRPAKDYSIKDAVFEVLPQAVNQAAGELGRVSAHTLFYHVRLLIQKYTAEVLTSKYFEQNLLPRYRCEVGALPEIYYEPRGTLYEPHTGRAVPLGTREVKGYQFPAWLYDKILFVEKKGLWPVFEAARLAERFDMAIVAGEDYATEACRVLFRHASKEMAYQIFVLHDADPFGYNIARTLQQETARMPGYRVDVIDLGLRLGDALDREMFAETFTRKKALPQGLQLTDAEREYFEGRCVGRNLQKGPWVCHRVELNAFSGPALIGYTVDGLHANGVRGKVIPPGDVLTKRLVENTRIGIDAIVRHAWASHLAELADRAGAEILPHVVAEMGDLTGRVRDALAKDADSRWDSAVAQVAAEAINRRRDEVLRAAAVPDRPQDAAADR